jgi:hypothetical protein
VLPDCLYLGLCVWGTLLTFVIATAILYLAFCLADVIERSWKEKRERERKEDEASSIFCRCPRCEHTFKVTPKKTRILA